MVPETKLDDNCFESKFLVKIFHHFLDLFPIKLMEELRCTFGKISKLNY